MSRPGLALTAAAIVALLAAPSTSATQEERVGGSAPVTSPAVLSPDRVIVQWAAGASPAERRAAREEADVSFAKDLGSRRFQLVETQPGQTPREAIRELEADPAVVLAERDGYYTLDAIPNDPLFDQLWGLQNTGLGIDGFAGALAGADIGAVSAWDRTVDTPDTVVAVLDSGYRFEHPDLADVVWTNLGETLDGVDNDGNGIVDDIHGADFVGSDAGAPETDGDPTDDDLASGGHGVHTAGTIGAQGGNGIGITGVAQNVRIMPLRVCAPAGEEGEVGCPHSAAIAAINYAGEKRARVANMSFGGHTENPLFRNALTANPQTLFVVSAGNDAQDNDATPRFPCSYAPSGVDNVVCVAATDQADRLAGFSNWGPSSVDLGAPGTETLSTFPSHRLIDDDFEVDDFALKWTDSVPNSGFSRTDEPPLTSFGMSDSPGAAPVAGTTRATTSAPITLQAGYRNCTVEFTREVRLAPEGQFFFRISLDGEVFLGIGLHDSGRFSYSLRDTLSEGGDLELSFSYRAGPDPDPGDGVWLDDIELRCIAQVGEADGYKFLSGTSMAAPHVTGAAALLFSLKPAASVTEVRQALLGSVHRVPVLAGKVATGGRLDAAAAVDLFDTVPPLAPTLSATSPASPADHNQPRLIGSAQPGTSIDVYANATCSGSPVESGTAAQLAGPGIAVTVEDDTVTAFSIKATDMVPLTSDCSAPISYIHVEAVETDPGGGAADPDGGTTGPGSDPGGGMADPRIGATDQAGGPAGPGRGAGRPNAIPARACIVPRLAGRTPAQARRALRAAACKLGGVWKPRRLIVRLRRAGKRPPPLVVRSSIPAMGKRSARGNVNLILRPKPQRATPRAGAAPG